MKAAMNIIEDVPLKLNHDHLMRQLITQHDFLLDLIGNKNFIFVDMPVYGNIGDLLIMQGTFKFFENNRIKPRLIAPIFAFDLDWIKPDDVVVFQGGGNFGDLYAGMQPLREKVAREKPDNRIIVLPQTIHFSSPEAMEKSAAIFRQHPDVHICVRDEHSYELAKEFTQNVYLTPDMAHHLYPIKSRPAIPHATLLLSRTDDEKSDKASLHHSFSTITDWPKLVGKREKNFRLFYLAMRAFYRSGMGILGNKIFAWLWPIYAQTLIQDAVNLFGRHEYIDTDRLHGHILACLMSKPHTVLDNSYGKNSRYSQLWTAHSEIVSLEKYAG
jgi:pyruvyl transferase EpsO